MRKKNYLYKSIFLYASLQFCGNIDTYFIKNTEKLLIFVIQPRIQNKGNLIRFYKRGKLIGERKVSLSSNIFFYYFLWFIKYLANLFYYFRRKDRVIVITSHPVSFFGMTIQKLLLDVRFLFWIEYFPRASLILKLFDDLKNHYHKRVDYSAYFGDRVNKLINGRVLNNEKRRTILWGVKPKIVKYKLPKGKKTLLFVGIVKESQGLNIVFKYLTKHADMYLKIIGVCDQKLYKKYQQLFSDWNIANQIYFPNIFIPDDELLKLSRKCFAGIAPYTTGPSNGTYFIDPGKVKAYAEMGLPIIMSNTSSVAPYIKKFHAGIIIKRSVSSLEVAINKTCTNYPYYSKGLKKFNEYFHFKRYYQDKFSYIE